MRLAPVPMYFLADLEDIVGIAADSSETTHGAREAVNACRYFAALLFGALRGDDKETLLSPNYWPISWWEPDALVEKIARIADGSFKDRDPPGHQGSLVGLLPFARLPRRPLLAVNLGDDADTTGAIYGQIAGAYYGVESIPAAWRDRLTMAAEITSLADSLHDHARPADGPCTGPRDPDGHVRRRSHLDGRNDAQGRVHLRLPP